MRSPLSFSMSRIKIMFSKKIFVASILVCAAFALAGNVAEAQTAPPGQSLQIFTLTLKRGSQNPQVVLLQKFLAHDPTVYPEGFVTGYFGSLTEAAVNRFQEKYAAEVLVPAEVAAPTGIVGFYTRLKLNQLVSEATGILFLTVDSPSAELSAEDALKIELQRLLGPMGVTVEDVTVQENKPSQELRVRWDTTVPNPFTILDQRKFKEALPTLGGLALTEDRLLVAAVDAQARLRGWTLIFDPRIRRLEGPGPTGALTIQVVIASSTDFLLPVPDDPAITDVKLYQPIWTGQVFFLTLAGTVTLR